MKRGYLLPEGCKDLIDVLEKAKKSSQHPILFFDLPEAEEALALQVQADLAVLEAIGLIRGAVRIALTAPAPPDMRVLVISL